MSLRLHRSIIWADNQYPVGKMLDGKTNFSIEITAFTEKSPLQSGPYMLQYGSMSLTAVRGLDTPTVP